MILGSTKFQLVLALILCCHASKSRTVQSK